MEEVSNPTREIILVVDDEESIRRMIGLMLAQSGYDCLQASCGAEALADLEKRSGNVDLLLTDLVMPDMSGAELARRVAQVLPDLPIMFMSGYSDDPIVQIVEKHPTFLAKPFTAAALIEKIRKALDQPWAGLSLPEERVRAGPG